jgi:hypothetical protein
MERKRDRAIRAAASSEIGIFKKQLTKTFVETLIDVGEKANKQFELKVILN